VAEATSPSYVDLRVPAEYQNDPFRFLALVRHLYLPSVTGFADQRARELTEEILRETAPHADIALAWEGIGRTILPLVRKLYTSDQPHASFYAALAGLRMGDDVAAEVIGKFAGDASSRYRLTAIEELGRAERCVRAALILRQLLDDEDPRIRVSVYEALLTRMDPVIETTMVGGSDFALDRVPSSRDNVIYVRRTGAPRIALLGSAVECRPPVFYESAHGLLTIDAKKDADRLTLVRRSPFVNRVSPPLSASLNVAELIAMLGDDPELRSGGEVHGLAMDYSSIAQAMYELCRTRSINAKFMIQSTSVTEMFGPLTPTGRAESDL
jgi:hypothetical protein